MKPIPRARLLRAIADHLVTRFPPGSAYQKKRRVEIPIPPMLTQLAFEGESLADFMIPTLNIRHDVAIDAFSKILFQDMQPEVLDGERVRGAISDQVLRLVRGSPERYIVWLGQQPGWEMVQGPNSLYAHNEVDVVGIMDGVVKCRYSEWLTSPKRDVRWPDINDWSTYGTHDKALIYISERLETEYDRALLGACAMVHITKFINLFAPAVRRVPQDLKEQAIEIVTGRHDIMGKLFKLLVPAVVDKRTFYRMFGCPSRWKLRYPEYLRERLYLKLKNAGLID